MTGDDGRVLEMGMHALGEIAVWPRSPQPRGYVITNVGPTHLNGWEA